jgi:glycosyltransferase involved in cell wall biosynthesis
MRVGYFVNQYPAPAHTFIRREIQALEALGVPVVRYAIRSGGAKKGDAQDEAEERKTRLIVGAGVMALLKCTLSMMVSKPGAFLRALRDAVRMGARSDRGLAMHLIYLAEATVLAEWCLRDEIDHLHAHFGTNSAAIAMFANSFSGVPYSFTVHGPEEFDKPEFLALGAKLERSAFAVCVSAFGRSQLMRWASPDQWKKIEIVHCGVDADFLGQPVTPPVVAPRLVCIGRLHSAKGQMILVKAVGRLRDAGVRCDVVVWGDGPFRKELETAIGDAGLQDAIRLAGWASSDTVREEILSARALVLPSFAEGLPVAIMEAMALSRPVISSYVAGIPELIIPGATGWLAPASDDVALAEAMQAALEASPEQLAAMGAAGRARVLERHDIMKEAAKLKQLFAASTSVKG